MKKLIAVLLLILNLTGCMPNAKLGDRDMVEGMAIDKSPNGTYKITLQISQPEEEEKPAQPVILQQEGRSVTEAMAESSLAQGRQMFLGNCTLLAIGEGLAGEDLRYLLNFFDTNHRVSPNMTVLLTKGEASELLWLRKEIPTLSAEHVAESAQAGRKGGWMGYSRLSDLTLDLKNQNCALLPIVTLEKPEEVSAQEEGAGEENSSQSSGSSSQDSGSSSQSSSQASEEEKVPPKLHYIGMGILQDAQVKAVGDASSSKGWAWLTNSKQDRQMHLEDQTLGKVSVLAYSHKVKLIPEQKGDLIVLKIQLKVRSNLVEWDLGSGEKPDKADLETIKLLETRQIEEEIGAFINATLRKGYDPLGVGLLIRQKFPELYRAWEPNWGKNLPEIGYDLQVSCELDQDYIQ